jgi:hypothetical protein
MDGPSGIDPTVVPPSGSEGMAGARSLGGSGGDKARTGGVGAGSTRGDEIGGTGTGTTGRAGVVAGGG